jgi:hypothetical protein
MMSKFVAGQLAAQPVAVFLKANLAVPTSAVEALCRVPCSNGLQAATFMANGRIKCVLSEY